MIRTYSYKNITWTDVQSPDRAEIEQLLETFDLDPRIPHEILTPSPETLVRTYTDTLFATLHFPVHKQTHSDMTEHTQEVDFIVGADFVVTVRYDTIDTLHRFTRKMEVGAITHRDLGEDISGVHFMYSILTEFYISANEELLHIGDIVNAVSKNMFQDREKDMVVTISHLGKTLLDFRNALTLHTTAYDDMPDMVENLFGKEERARFYDVRTTHQRILRHIEHYRQVVGELRETNQALLTTRQNEITKNLTVIAFITFPVTMIASLFGMTLESTPLRGQPYDFWIVVGAMITLMLIAFVYFRFKKWI